jgi:succinate-acetate transporter protein
MANAQAADAAPFLVGGFDLMTVVLNSVNAALFPVGAVGVFVPVAVVYGELVRTVTGVECSGELAAGRGTVAAL